MPPISSRPVAPRVGRLAQGFSAAIAALALLLGAAAASGQTFRETDPGRTPGWVFTPTFVFSTAYDSNVTLASVGSPTQSDALTTLTPVVDLQYRAKHNWVGFGYDGSWSLYRTLNGLDTYDQDLHFDSHHDVSRRVALLFHEQFAKHPSTDVIELVGIPFLRTGSRLNDARGEVRVRLAAHTTASGSYSNEWVDFDQLAPFSQFLRGGMAHAWIGSLEQEISPRLTVGAGYTFRRANIADNGGTVDTQEGAGNVAYRATPTLTLSGSLGFARLHDLTTLASQTGPSWRLGAEQRFERATVSASWTRSYVPSFALGGTLQNQEFTANLRMPLARNRLYWQSGVSWRRSDPINLGEQRLRSFWFTNWIGYSIQRWLRVEGYFWRNQQNSPVPGGIVDRSRIGVQLVTAMPMRIQ